MDVKEAVLGRRSIRKYKAQAVNEQDVCDILEAAIYAPSGISVKNELGLKQKGRTKPSPI